MVQDCCTYRKIPLVKLDVEQIRLLVSQEIRIEFLIDLAMGKLEENILAEGNYYGGDLLESISKIPASFWLRNKSKIESLKQLVQSNSTIILDEMGNKKLDTIINRIKHLKH